MMLYRHNGFLRRSTALAAVLALYVNSAAAQTLSGSSLASPFNNGSFQVEKGPRWTLVSTAGAGVQAIVSQAAGIAGVRHVVDCVSFSAYSKASGVTAVNVYFEVLDGANIVYISSLAFPTAVGVGVQEVAPFGVCGLGIEGTAATSMTVEFTAGVTGAQQQLSASGYDVSSP